ncbi:MULTISPECIES: M15 family metallopeptidase [Oerskovia]|uniref:M15 family metallopeptidase n=2 Tax=Oerskovia TaxID=162491 RepID=A0ABW1X5C8_9CELL|nr:MULTISPECIES: M15 family metallopeptidase [Oerskovia]MBM7496009.1 LAS superfamily LD-carboxypeptidase LdcB [Oerskovia paurometabola]
MGKHSQRRFAATLPGRSLRRRSPFAIAAALATVAVTTTAGAASMTTSPDGSQAATASASAPVTSAAGPVATTPEEKSALDAASTQLVRAEYLASEGTSSLTPEQLAQVTATRDQLRQLLDVTRTSETAARGTTTIGSATDPTLAASTALETGAALDTSASLDDATTLAAGTADGTSADETLDGRDTFRASRAGADGREPLTTDGTAEAPEASTDTATTSPEEAAQTTTDQATTGAVTAGTTADPVIDHAQVAPTTTEIGAATEALRTVLDAAAVAVSVQPAPTAEEIAAQQAAEEAAQRAAMAAQLAAWANSTAGYSNGTIPESLLCSPSFAPGQLVRCDAAYQLEQLNVAYRAAFGTDISVTSSYRSFGSQVAVKASKGYLAAAPGTSNHGMAQALDLGGGISSFGSAQYAWMRANAPAYGWDNPEWARQGGSKPEAWHWEYGTTY